MGKWREEGFVASDVDFYKDQLKKIFINAYGPDFLLDDSLPQGILITALAEWAYGLDMDGVEAFSQLNPNTASGIWLDMLGQLRGIPRNHGTPQMATVTIKCDPATFIPFTVSQGHVFTTVNTGDSFEAVAGKLIDSPEVTMILRYASDGNSSASIGTKLETNGMPAILDIEITYLMDGIATESDVEYRSRMRQNYPAAGQTINIIQNQIKALQFVKTVGHNYNDSAETVDTLPPYTTEFMAVPESGTDMTLFKETIGSIILNNKVPGSPTAGNTSVRVVDVFGTEKEVKFTIPTEVKLQIDVRVGTPETTGFVDLANINDMIIEISKYINSLDIGKDVSYSRCIAPLVVDPGFDVLQYRIRELPNGEAWVSNKEYKSGNIVRYDGVFYVAQQDNPESVPGLGPGWEVYDEGWVVNGNYSIGARQYASIDPQNITIGA